MRQSEISSQVLGKRALPPNTLSIPCPLILTLALKLSLVYSEYEASTTLPNYVGLLSSSVLLKGMMINMVRVSEKA